MGFRVLGFSLIIFIYLIILPPAYPLHNTLPSEFVQKSKLEDKGLYGSKIEGGTGHGGNSHGNGISGSTNTRGVGGGGAVIPVYAAGAANRNGQHQTRHGAANCNLDKIRFSNMLMITLVYPLVLFFRGIVLSADLVTRDKPREQACWGKLVPPLGSDSNLETLANSTTPLSIQTSKDLSR
ncbi:hypothetical protein CR513_27117, partial [Mucuna pruriens]